MATDTDMPLPIVGIEMQTLQLEPCMDMSGFNGLFLICDSFIKSPPFRIIIVL